MLPAASRRLRVIYRMWRHVNREANAVRRDLPGPRPAHRIYARAAGRAVGRRLKS